MIYICHEAFNGNCLSGEMEIDRAAILQAENGILYYRGKPVCLVNSQAGKDHFARHDDGAGLRRGELTKAITRLRKAPAKYYNPSGIGFTAELYAEGIPVLEAILKDLKEVDK